MPSVEQKKTSVVENLDDTLRDFKQLAISDGEPCCSTQAAPRKRSQSCTIFTISDTVSNSPATSSSRFRPYALPKINRISSTNASNSTALKPRPKIIITDSNDESSIEVPTDLPESKTPSKCSFKKYQSCSQEAGSPVQQQKLDEDSNELNSEIDELAEYFAHFVSVQFKMSALAESMYA